MYVKGARVARTNFGGENGSLLVVGLALRGPGRRGAELLEPHVYELLGPIYVTCGSLQVDVVPFPPEFLGRRVRHGNLAA